MYTIAYKQLNLAIKISNSSTRAAQQ